MGKKDKKSKVDKKARVAEKQSKKAAQKEKKASKKGPAGDDSDAEDVDLDAVLAQYAEQQAQFLKVTEVGCEPPPSRSSATLIGSPSNSNELFLFGGEYFNGALAKFFNDLYVYIIDKDEWRQITSPNSPLPRSGHAWCRGGNTGGIYLFGGEFSSPKQGTFYHYNDFWRLEPSTREWTRIETKGKGPPARSGHRMTYYKNYIILFGGFQDTSQQTKYLNDLWIYDCSTFTWHNPILPQAAQKPDARSSFSFLPHDQGAVIYGGYSRIKLNTTAGRQTKGGGGMAQRSILKPVIHQDTWFLRIVQPGSDAPANAPPTIRWERRKRPANPPNPPRAGVTMAHHKGRGILFGGVYDVEESEEGIDSEFFNTLFAWNVERNRFFQLTIRRPRSPPKKQQAADRGGRRGRGKADEEELLRNLAALEAKLSIDDAESVKISKTPDEDEDDEPAKPQKNVLMELPHPRFNTAMAVQDDVLYLFGGTFEKGDREYTFDEMWAVDLGKLDGVTELFKRELENWEGSEDEESEEEDEDEEESGDESDAEAEAAAAEASTRATSLDSEETAAAAAKASKGKDAEAAASSEDPANATEDATASSALAQADGLPYPRPFESLRDFFARSSTQWQDVLLAKLEKAGVAPEARSIKEIRKQAFEMAEEKWWDCREEIRALEDEQEEAGIGEVVALEERGSGGGGGAGRRR
ncbi:galactose oxidase [Xylona heveae TC161]|uniref:Galactose oxidase n=1 Tax=Xylona heveae (strain CBS 132557 / TC161) TaxID=1328760 RepID=A0A165I465_XYLHT|nr:galactose oxidase [Xylona heveae TC161]KZF24359.1 galactose oxidase [Xylona heveae TC161]